MNIKDTILIIEDEQSILRFMMSLLKRNGYRVLSTVTGADALVLIESHCPDLIILDLGLPDIDGIPGHCCFCKDNGKGQGSGSGPECG